MGARPSRISHSLIGAALAPLALAAGAGPAFAGGYQADPRDARISALEAQVQALIGEMRELKAKPAPVSAASVPGIVATARGATPPASTPDTPRPNGPSAVQQVASISGGKPVLASPDGRFSANFHGVMQFDAADYMQDAARPVTVDLRRGGSSSDTAHARDLNDGTTFRRARIGIDGKMFGDFEYNVLFDFGGSGAEDGGHVQELWAQYSGLKPFHLRIGAFRPSQGIEDQGSTNGMLFLERPAPTDTIASLSGSDYREGAQLWAATDRWYASGAVTSRLVGTINSTATGTAQSFDQALGFVGRGAFQPFVGKDWLTHLGVHGSYAYQVADAGGPDTAVGTARYPIQYRERPEVRVDGTRLVDTGAIDADHGWVLGFEAAAQKGPFLIQGEYESFGIGRRASALSDPGFHGWYVEAAWTLTGERRKYNTNTAAFDAPPVTRPFDLKQGTWGAWELALRYSDLGLNYHQGFAGAAAPTDGVRGGEQKIFTAGLNWYLNPLLRLMLDYQHVDIDRLSPSAATFATPIGAQVGQVYDTVIVRTQLAF